MSPAPDHPVVSLAARMVRTPTVNPPGDERRVFEKFYRGPTARGADMGLGLAICRSIAFVHDGSLTAENRPGGGAIFRLRLPFLDRPPESDLLGDPPSGGERTT